MIELKTAQGVSFFVDAADVAAVRKFTWCCDKGYISRHIGPGGSRQFLHQFLLQDDGQGCREIDHIDQNPLNNCRSNLRRSDRVQQMLNARKRCDNSSGVKGVALRRGKHWMAYIDVDRQRRYLYSGPSFEAAVAARLAAEVVFHQPILEKNYGQCEAA